MGQQGITRKRSRTVTTPYLRVAVGVFVCIFGLAGVLLLFVSSAAVPSFSFEVEDEAYPKTVGARVVDDTSSSAGTHVEFGAATSRLKPVIKGLMPRQGILAQDLTHSDGKPIFDHAVVHLLWKDLEKKVLVGSRMQETFSTPETEREWAKVADYTSKGISVRLRIMAGIHAPNFTKGAGVSAPEHDCSAGGIALNNPVDDTWGCVPHFWTDGFLNQYQELMQEVSRRFDLTADGRLVLDVVDSACMTVYAEPFYRAHNHAESSKRLWDAGLNEATDRHCHSRALQIHDSAFQQTRVSLAVNNWEIITNANTQYVISRNDGMNKIRDFLDNPSTGAKVQYGQKLVLQNNGLGASPAEGCPDPPSNTIYCYLKSAPHPKGYQSETWVKLGSELGLFTAVQNGLNAGAAFIELPNIPNNGIRNLSLDTLRSKDRQLECNALGASSDC
jgi:hypothetical protein